jgi:hypothetical protein
MPYTDSHLPFNGLTPSSRHASHAGAKDAQQRAGNQTVRYLQALKEHGGLTDAEAAFLLNLERTSVNARRAPLVKAGLVIADGFRKGPTGKIKNTVWRLAK